MSASVAKAATAAMLEQQWPIFNDDKQNSELFPFRKKSINKAFSITYKHVHKRIINERSEWKAHKQWHKNIK